MNHEGVIDYFYGEISKKTEHAFAILNKLLTFAT